MKTTFEIQTRTGREEVSGHIFKRITPHLGLNSEARKVWKITHLKSGKYIIIVSGPFNVAKEILREIKDVMDWSLPEEKILKDKEGISKINEIRNSIYQYIK